MKTTTATLKRHLASLVGAGMALLAVTAVVDGANRLKDAQGLVGSMVRSPLRHAQAALALTGWVTPARAQEPAEEEDAFALVDPELSVREAVQAVHVEVHEGCPSRRRALPARVRNQSIELSVSPAAPRWLQRALLPLMADGA